MCFDDNGHHPMMPKDVEHLFRECILVPFFYGEPNNIAFVNSHVVKLLSKILEGL